MLENSPDTAPDITAVEDLIRQRMSDAKAMELTIGPGSFGIEAVIGHVWQAIQGGKLCLIGVTVLGTIRTRGGVCSDFQKLTGISTRQIAQLEVGFDHLVEGGKTRHDKPYYALGQKFRREVDAGLWR